MKFSACRKRFITQLLSMASESEENEELFARRAIEMTKTSFTTASIAIGVDLDLFDGMAKMDGPQTSQHIADKLGCKERYIREWLNSLVVGDIVTYNAEDHTYLLPKHRASALSGINPNCLPLMNVALATLTQNYEKVKECFRKDGPQGIGVQNYSGMPDLLEKMSYAQTNTQAIEGLVSNVPGLKDKLENGILVCEAGCGRGHFLMVMAKRFPKSHMTGFDIDNNEITRSVKEAERRGLKNVSFVTCDIHSLPAQWTNKWDYIYSDKVIHDLPDPDKALAELYKICKPGGYYSQIDFNLHSDVEQNMNMDLAPMLYSASFMYCLPISLHFKNGAALGGAWGTEMAKRMMESAGFDVTLHAENHQVFFHAVCLKKSH